MKESKTIVATINNIVEGSKVWTIKTDKIELSLFISNVKFDTSILKAGDTYSFSYFPKVSDFRGKQQITNWLNSVEFASNITDQTVCVQPKGLPPIGLKLPPAQVNFETMAKEKNQTITDTSKDKNDSIRRTNAINCASVYFEGMARCLASNECLKGLNAKETKDYVNSVWNACLKETQDVLGVEIISIKF